MNYSIRARSIASLFVILCLLAAPLTALAKKGEKNYKRGLEFEAAQQWERAAQEFALAVATLPSDIEYQLHYRRAVFNASQKFMEKGRTLADQGDYTGAYNAFRQAYGYDPVNDLAASEMERMLRLQREKDGSDKPPTRKGGDGTPSTMPASYQTGVGGNPLAHNGQSAAQQPSTLAQGPSATLRVAAYSGDLEAYIRQLANELNLNVIFDRDFPKRQININLKDVTTAKVLDDIFLSQGLFFQKIDRRTILVADQSKRPQYQQLVLRTFYLSNIDPNDARSLIQASLPANSGRQAIVTPNKNTNSITVRDTPENIALIGQLINSIDKDRAEVVMDVSIYEVSRTDLLQLGNQIGDQTQLNSLGGLQAGSLRYRSSLPLTLGNAAVPLSSGLGLLIPSSTISAFQSKNNTRLLASTQVHAFDAEQSTTRIGQKVPVQTAQVTPYGYPGTQANGTPGSGNVGNVFGGGGYPVIQYQDTGLILKFTPQVFPNLDVQVKMEIESNDVIGAATLTPTFSQRAVSGMARIPNNRTMMIASVAQDKQSNGRQGLPLLGLIPIFGRLFSTPTKNNNNADIVITVTPRVLRAPTVTPDDLELRGSGTQLAPVTDSLEAMVQQADRDDLLAAARQLPTNATVQLPAATTTASVNTNETDPPPAFVPAPKLLTNGTTGETGGDSANVSTSATTNSASGASMKTTPAVVLPGPAANTSATTHVPVPAVEKTSTPTAATNAALPLAISASAAAPSGTELYVLSGNAEMKVGEKQRLMLLVKTSTPLGLAATTLRFNPRVVAVRSISKGSLFGEGTQTAPSITQSIDANGSLLALIAPTASAPINGMGVLLFIEVEALAPGETEIKFDQAGVHLMSSDGHNIIAQLKQAHLTVK